MALQSLLGLGGLFYPSDIADGTMDSQPKQPKQSMSSKSDIEKAIKEMTARINSRKEKPAMVNKPKVIPTISKIGKKKGTSGKVDKKIPVLKKALQNIRIDEQPEKIPMAAAPKPPMEQDFVVNPMVTSPSKETSLMSGYDEFGEPVAPRKIAPAPKEPTGESAFKKALGLLAGIPSDPNSDRAKRLFAMNEKRNMLRADKLAKAYSGLGGLKSNVQQFANPWAGR